MPQTEIKTAVILAAGLGSRLRPHTNDLPKCFVEVNGVSILEQSLKLLSENGIKHTVIVVGYLAETIIERLGQTFQDMALTYIHNEDYQNTNSMYSAWLASKYLDLGTLLIEGDTLYEAGLLEKALSSDKEKSYWVLDQFHADHDGSMCIGNAGQAIEDHRIVREELQEYKNTYFKSTGVLKLTAQYGKKFAGWLEHYVQENDVNIYYDNVIARHLKDEPIYILDVTGVRWFEIDTPEDLKKAKTLFASA